MTPEQIDRTIEFILEHQAQATQLIERGASQTRDIQAAVITLTQLAQLQSNRLDHQEETFQALLRDYDVGHREAMARLDEVLRRLTERR